MRVKLIKLLYLDYINKTGPNISNSVYEVSQDDNGPDVYPSTTATIFVPPAAIIKINQEFRKITMVQQCTMPSLMIMSTVSQEL